MDSSDKEIWDAAYCEEYDGLASIPTWEVLSESQFKLLSKGRKPLPSMAIFTIKYDSNNQPKRAKYRIVVLGNLDYHNCSKASTAAPGMSQLELRFLTALAVFHKRTLKNCDSNLLSSLLFLLKKNILFALWLAVIFCLPSGWPSEVPSWYLLETYQILIWFEASTQTLVRETQFASEEHGIKKFSKFTVFIFWYFGRR
jgi:uncharacterized protein YhhL (DUF1145 family)